MSRVNNALLSFGTLENEQQRMLEVNAVLRGLDSERPQTFANGNDPRNLCPWYGGGKFMEAALWGAAFNWVTLDQVQEGCRAARWLAPERVQIIWKGQEDDTWTIHGIAATSEDQNR